MVLCISELTVRFSLDLERKTADKPRTPLSEEHPTLASLPSPAES